MKRMGVTPTQHGSSIGPTSAGSPAVQIRRLKGDDEREQYLHFRWQMLRRPHGQPEGSEQDADDEHADHIVATLEGDDAIVGVARLHEAMPGQGQVRYMAVHPDFRGRGVGRALLEACESLAHGRGFLRVILEARSDALGFYLHMGYQRGNPGKVLFGSLRHIWMHKRLHPDNFQSLGVCVRPAHPEDRAAVERLVFTILDSYGLAREPEGIDADLEEFPSLYNGGFFHLICERDALAGCIALLPLDKTRCELRRMYLDPRWRGRGIGRAMLGYGLGRAREMGYKRVEVETARVLGEALELYLWAGFTPIDEPCVASRCDLRMALDFRLAD